MSIKFLGDTSLARLVDNFKTRANSIGTRISAMEGKTPAVKPPSVIKSVHIDNTHIPTSQNQFGTWWISVKSYINSLPAITEMQIMFANCSNLTSVDFSDCDFSAVTNMGQMFSECSNLTSVDFSGCDLSAVTAMGYMFYNCSNLTSVDFSDCDLSNVTSVPRMFGGCSNLTSVDFSDCDLSNVTDISSMMFNTCSNLTSVDFSGCGLSAATNMGQMFYNCRSLTSVDFTDCDLSKVTTVTSMFYNCTSLTSLKWGGAISGTPLDLTKTKLTPAAAETFFNSVSTKTRNVTIQIKMPVTATGANTSGITAKGYTVTFATS